MIRGQGIYLIVSEISKKIQNSISFRSSHFVSIIGFGVIFVMFFNFL